MKSVILLVMLMVAIGSVHGGKMQRILFNLTEYPGAQCLDGSSSGIYYAAGSGSGADKYLLYFEGGSLCLGPTKQSILTACYDRSKTPLGSSKSWSEQRNAMGMMSDDPSKNMFYNWNRIYIPYCDGACHQGYLEAPQEIFGTQLYFRGYNITIQTFNYVLKNFNISSASQVILSGASAGGLGVLYWANYLGDLLNPAIKYMAIADSGYFLDYPPKGLFMKCIKKFASLNNPATTMPANCPYAETEGQQYKCMMPQYFIQKISYPLFLIQSQYDLFEIMVAVGVLCESSLGISFQKCNTEQMTKINDYRTLIYGNLTQNLNTPHARYFNWGGWAPSCAMHTWTITNGLFNSTKYQVPEYSGHTIQASLQTWIEQITTGGSQQVLYIDNVTWPGNQPCSGEKSGFLPQVIDDYMDGEYDYTYRSTVDLSLIKYALMEDDE